MWIKVSFLSVHLIIGAFYRPLEYKPSFYEKVNDYLFKSFLPLLFSVFSAVASFDDDDGNQD